MNSTIFVDLKRQFMPFKDEKEWELHYTAFGSEEYFGAQNWDELLSHNRVVVLAEAGAGKTAELRAVAARLNDENPGSAFYVTLNAVAKQGLFGALETLDDQKSYRDWKAAISHCWFFIDSLDEARLNGATFQTALSILQKELAPHLDRAKILVSCRVSDWRSLSDAADFEKYLGNDKAESDPVNRTYANADDALLSPIFDDNSQTNLDRAEGTSATPASGIHVVALAPLSRRQAERLANCAGVADTAAFLKAVHEADATDLANRPQDLLALVKQWSSEGTIGTKHSALKWSIRQRLQETNLDLAGKDTLTFDQAYRGAKVLAAQLTFGKKRLLSWPSEPSTGATTHDALDPREALPSLSGSDVARLLNRAIFDPATLGAVRFHHRSVQELLCAEWLLDQIENGCPFRSIWSLLVNDKYGKARFRPSLRPVTAWLAQLEPRFLKRVIELEPDLLIGDGDPKLIPIEDRKKLLEKFYASYKGRDDAGISIDINQVARLASPELADTIRRLWSRSDNGGEIRDLLLRLIWVGQLRELGDIALQAIKASKREYERSIAARALLEIATDEQRSDLASFLVKRARTFPARAMAPAIQVVFPRALDLDGLEQIIRKHPRQTKEMIHSGINYGLEQLAEDLPLERLEGFALTLAKLINQKPWVDKHGGRLSRKHGDLLSPLALACSRIVRLASGGAVSKEIASTIRNAAQQIGYHGYDYQTEKSRKALSSELQNNRIVNKQLFDLCLEEHGQNGDAAWRFFNGFFDEPWTVAIDDFDLFLDGLKIEGNEARALCLLNTCFGIAYTSDHKIELLGKIDTAIEGRNALEAALHVLKNPPPRKIEKWEREHNRRMREIKKKQDRREKRNKQSWIDFRDRLRKDPSVLRSEAPFGTLYDIQRWLTFEQRYANRDEQNWDGFEQAFGLEVASAAEDALAQSWRSCDPGYLHRQGKRTIGGDVGRLGIQIDSDHDSQFVTKLSSDDIAIASRLAWTELNEIPVWATKVWGNRTDISEKIVKEEVRWELKRKSKSQREIHVLYKLARVPEPFKSRVARWVLDELKAAEPTNTAALRTSLELITASTDDFRGELSALSAVRFANLRRREHRVLWLSVLLSTDASAGLTVLKQWLKSQKYREAADQLMIDLLATLFPNRGPSYGSKYQSFRRLPYLKDLLELVYRHVRREDDLEHDGVYSPGARDAAQDARNMILGMLLEILGEETVTALNDLASLPELRLSRERFEVLADQRATRDADLSAWTASELLDFSSRFSLDPKSIADLHSVVMDRLTDIKDEMETGTFSNKALLRQDHLKRAEERPVQLAIAQQLQLRKGGAYSHVREPEQEDFNEPDILILKPDIAAPLPLEVKVADSWSYKQLLEALRDQLAGKYMKERNATHGILLMTHHNKKQTWQHSASKVRLNFGQLCQSLNTAAREIARVSENIEYLEVVGVSLS